LNLPSGCESDVLQQQLIEDVLRSETVELHSLYAFELQRDDRVLDEAEPIARRPTLDREDVDRELQAHDSIRALTRIETQAQHLGIVEGGPLAEPAYQGLGVDHVHHRILSHSRSATAFTQAERAVPRGPFARQPRKAGAPDSAYAAAMQGDEALAPLVGGHLDTVSFVMDYVEFRIGSTACVLSLRLAWSCAMAQPRLFPSREHATRSVA
jgi:hypothetical protein